ncbi:MAG TPA: L,D-transpeptidase [Coriobacteriia bacterium]|nr:L,D-transpeptidase [Coriobacteriia bacterium]
MKLRNVWRVAALSVLVALVVSVAPVYAVGRGAVTNNVTYNGTSLIGSDETSITAYITANPPATPALEALAVVDGPNSFSFDTKTAVEPDVAAMVAQAYTTAADPSAAYAVQPKFKVKQAVVTAWSVTVAKAVDRSGVNAKRVLKKKRLKLVKEKLGWKVDRPATTAAITASIDAALSGGTLKPAQVVAVVKSYSPKVTSKNIGKAILVVLSERKIYLYKGSKLEMKVGCAIGQPKYPTPTGDFKIIRKSPAPIWRNPAKTTWGKNMPDMIPAGPRNPLGLRALYLNAPGIRIHGTYKYYSIGHAASHGCMRVGNKTIVKFYPKVPVGTPVKIIK